MKDVAPVVIHPHDVELPSCIQPVTINTWLEGVAKEEGFSIDHFSIVLCSDAYLLGLNQQHLNHNTLTDVITFDYSNAPLRINGECFISLHRVEENAAEYAKGNLASEIHRVIVHALLHLCGYSDKSSADQESMRKKEDDYLAFVV